MQEQQTAVNIQNQANSNTGLSSGNQIILKMNDTVSMSTVGK